MSDIETRVQQIAQVLGQLEDTQVPRNIRNSVRDAVEKWLLNKDKEMGPEITIDLYDDWYDSDISKKELSNFNTEKTRNYLVENEFFISNKMNNFYSAWKSLKL